MPQSQETNSQRCTASKLQISRDMARAIYSARLAIFIYGITSAKRTREVRSAILVRESKMQLVMYSLDKCIRYSTYLLTFKSQKRSIEALDFLIITS
jgi:hypothetical protein